ncbi:DUF6473 family protein, partial [Ruegeria arenilitoris]|uniref:DUF6473 family protein n=1 Tax=Ruegeria arenilitoris TaxID=1173585 RepID=UPI0020C4FAF6
MSYHHAGSDGPVDSVCQYAGSKLWFRGPERSLDAPYIACVGGDETFGRFVGQPFVDLLERRLEKTCVNLGSLFSGVEALSLDAGMLRIVNDAELCVLQLPDVLSQSNHFYRVHPRRNDRFLEPTRDLLSLYPDVDFTEVHFVRHLLARLQTHSDARIEAVAQELSEAWVLGMRSFLERVTAPVLLLWLHVNDQDVWEDAGTTERDLVPVTQSMVDQIRPLCADCVELQVQTAGASEELEDAMFGSLQQPMALHCLGPSAHRHIASCLY